MLQMTFYTLYFLSNRVVEGIFLDKNIFIDILLSGYTHKLILNIYLLFID